MSSEAFSFSKKPIYCNNSKRHSVISDIIPGNDNSNYTTTRSTRYPESSSSRTFSSNSESQGNNLLKSTASPDDPLLDYDEQIRAPKFQTKKSLDDIGSASNQFESNDLMDKAAQKAKARANKRKNSSKSSVNNQNGEILVEYQDSTSTSSLNPNKQQQQQNVAPRSTYQPAKVDISQLSTSDSSSYPKTTTSTSLGGDNMYNIEQYLVNSNSSNNIIYNHAPSESTTNSRTDTATTTPLSSKKNSNESIHQFSSKKTPRFSMAPLRPLDDPKTPNYIPCVLRPNSYHSSAFDQTTLTDNYDETTEQANTLSHEHWKPNNAATSCFDCDRPFSLINRRHHCRKCGEIFCANCLLSKAKLNYDCKFDINGILAKVCFSCGKNWSTFIIENFKQVDRSLYPNFKKRDDVITSENDHHQEQHQQQQFGDKREVTVPADWSWSSF